MTMTTYDKIYLLVLIFMVTTMILSYLVDWTITRNGFTMVSMWGLYLTLGLIGGRKLTEKEMMK